MNPLPQGVLGAQYYRPPNPPRADWERDLRLMRESGMNTVKYWACWSWMAAQPDTVDFADLDELMDLAGRNGLGVVINTILENAPYRLEQRWPGARYVDHEDRPVRLTAAMNTPGGGWPGLCFDNSPVWEAAARFLTTLVRRYRGHPALQVWDVWNEPHLEPASYFPRRMYCYCPASLDAFRVWLRDRYPDLDALNRAWSRRYTHWTQVSPPRLFEAVPDMLDWREFWFDNLAGWLRRRCDTVRAADPDHPVMTHVALSGFTGQLATHSLDEFTLTTSVDGFGTSSFPTWLMGDDHVEHLFNVDTARDAATPVPFWQAELQGGRGRRDGTRSTPHPSPDVTGLWILDALAAGATGVMFWQWRPELLGPESPGYGLVTPDGSPTERLAAVTRLAELATHPLLRERTTAPAATGLLVSRRAALHAFATDRTMDLYRDAVLGAYRLLTDADVPVTILHEDRLARDGVPGHVRRVYWPMPAVCTSQLADALAAFVAAGGHLLAECAPGEYDGHGYRRPTVPGAGLDALFGVRQLDADVLPSGTVVTLAEPARAQLRGAMQREALRLADAEAIGVFPDGTVAVTRRRAGGTATLIATYPSLAYHAERDPDSRVAVTSLLDVCPAPRLISWDTPGPGLVSREARLADGRTAVFVLNWSLTDQICHSSRPLSTLPPAAPFTTTFHLAPHHGLVLLSK